MTSNGMYGNSPPGMQTSNNQNNQGAITPSSLKDQQNVDMLDINEYLSADLSSAGTPTGTPGTITSPKGVSSSASTAPSLGKQPFAQQQPLSGHVSAVTHQGQSGTSQPGLVGGQPSTKSASKTEKSAPGSTPPPASINPAQFLQLQQQIMAQMLNSQQHNQALLALANQGTNPANANSSTTAAALAAQQNLIAAALSNVASQQHGNPLVQMISSLFPNLSQQNTAMNPALMNSFYPPLGVPAQSGPPTSAGSAVPTTILPQKPLQQTPQPPSAAVKKPNLPGMPLQSATKLPTSLPPGMGSLSTPPKPGTSDMMGASPGMKREGAVKNPPNLASLKRGKQDDAAMGDDLDMGEDDGEMTPNQPGSKRSSKRGGRSGKPRAKTCQRWTEEQNRALREAVLKYGPRNWKKIAEEIGNVFTADQCNQHWHRVLNPRIIKGDWTPAEDELLFERVSTYGESSWTKIAEGIPGRTDIQCRHRYFQRKKELGIPDDEPIVKPPAMESMAPAGLTLSTSTASEASTLPSMAPPVDNLTMPAAPAPLSLNISLSDKMKTEPEDASPAPGEGGRRRKSVGPAPNLNLIQQQRRSTQDPNMIMRYHETSNSATHFAFIEDEQFSDEEELDLMANEEVQPSRERKADVTPVSATPSIPRQYEVDEEMEDQLQITDESLENTSEAQDSKEIKYIRVRIRENSHSEEKPIQVMMHAVVPYLEMLSPSRLGRARELGAEESPLSAASDMKFLPTDLTPTSRKSKTKHVKTVPISINRMRGTTNISVSWSEAEENILLECAQQFKDRNEQPDFSLILTQNVSAFHPLRTPQLLERRYNQIMKGLPDDLSAIQYITIDEATQDTEEKVEGAPENMLEGAKRGRKKKRKFNEDGTPIIEADEKPKKRRKKNEGEPAAEGDAAKPARKRKQKDPADPNAEPKKRKGGRKKKDNENVLFAALDLINQPDDKRAGTEFLMALAGTPTDNNAEGAEDKPQERRKRSVKRVAEQPPLPEEGTNEEPKKESTRWENLKRKLGHVFTEDGSEAAEQADDKEAPPAKRQKKSRPETTEAEIGQDISGATVPRTSESEDDDSDTSSVSSSVSLSNLSREDEEDTSLLLDGPKVKFRMMMDEKEDSRKTGLYELEDPIISVSSFITVDQLVRYLHKKLELRKSIQLELLMPVNLAVIEPHQTLEQVMQQIPDGVEPVITYRSKK